ncbi:hypothetical protein JTE90_021382 [Oedothorax gibbosus]|uniref:Allatostatin C n=1 Tax=Oedothorax gibbosus TaxID=931172 RepID=A0AAV6VH03_9ARAC|nr:hypothetical protein JTE90_021382 [Oedothorax gibbosus]
MVYYMRICSLLVASLLLVSFTPAKAMPQQEKVYSPSQLDVADNDGSPDNALLNYLFARQMVRRLRSNMDVSDLQRKRSYWKQCAFNAVSCFGKK